MTVLIGIHCKDGVVIGADSSATFTVGQQPLIEQPTKKIDIIGGQVIVAGTGQVGLGQRFKYIVETAYKEKLFTKSHIEIGRTLAQRTINDFAATSVVKSQYGAIVAFCSGDKTHLCEFAISDFQPEFKEIDRSWFVSMGNGQVIADPFLAFVRSIFWRNGIPTCQEGILATVWALSHTIDVNAGGIKGPLDITVLRRHQGKLVATQLEEGDLSEHRQNIYEMEERLRNYKNELSENKSIPEIPS